jgi:hypothetical protein
MYAELIGFVQFSNRQKKEIKVYSASSLFKVSAAHLYIYRDGCVFKTIDKIFFYLIQPLPQSTIEKRQVYHAETFFFSFFLLLLS